MGSIKDAIRVIAYYCVGRDLGAVADGKDVPGILLNLNRPFERLLINSLETLDGFKRDREPLNEIYSLDSTGRPTSIDPMRPDCKGMLTVGSNEKYIVLDAKHKIFVDEKGEIENVSRADLYQAISYGLTSKHQAKTQTVGLVGLSKEDQISDLLVSRISDIVVDYGSERFVVQRYTINFAAALIKIYRALQSTGSPEAVYAEIGSLLKSGILKPEVFSKAAG